MTNIIIFLPVSKCCGASILPTSRFCSECWNVCEVEAELQPHKDYGQATETAHGNALHKEKENRSQLLLNH